jgi:hypothetical protein
MNIAVVPKSGISLLLIEGGLTAVAVGLAFSAPKVGSHYFNRCERLLSSLARRRGLSVVVVGLAEVLLRLMLLPVCPMPRPFVPDDFSFLLAANTFASGELTNPTPVMWQHFESIQISMKPTYTSMYFPAQGLILASGKVLFGHPWFGLLCVNALMCCALCWMLQGWLPPGWALLGGALAVLRLGLFSYWVNSYSGAGSVAALGGALVLGALPRWNRSPRLLYSMLMAIGLIVLATSRPYEGLILSLPVVAVFLWRTFHADVDSKTNLAVLIALPLLLILLAGTWMGYYDYRAFGSPLTLPYSVNRTTYAMAPYFIWQKERPEPAYRFKEIHDFYFTTENSREIRSPSGLVRFLIRPLSVTYFFGAFALLAPLIMAARVVRDGRTRFLLLCLGLMTIGVGVEVFLLPHYLAPFTAGFYALGLQAMRHLRVWRPLNQPIGLAMTRLIIIVCFAIAGLRAYAEVLPLQLPEWSSSWSGPGPLGRKRAEVELHLEQLPGPQLAIVRYGTPHSPYDEWVYNAPDIDHSKVIWAREMSPAENQELIRYYKDRKVWLVEPDLHPVEIAPYPVSQAGAGESASTAATLAP